MDAIVAAALKKWPAVPACHGWLALDARGDWYLRDDRTQAAGPFPQAKGSVLRHEGLRAFIARNYLADAEGCWYFQNGPQRVYVELEAAPLVLGVQRDGDRYLAHCDHLADAGNLGVRASWLDGQGRLFLETERGYGLLRSLDMDAAADALSAGHWPAPQELAFDQMPARFGYRLSPQQVYAPR